MSHRIDEIRERSDRTITNGMLIMVADRDVEYLLAKLDSVRDVARKYAHPGCNTGCHGCGHEILRLLGDRP